MKHLKEYNNLADYEADYYGGKLSFPHVCVINGEVVYGKQYQAVQEKNLPFYVEAIEDLVVSFTKNAIQYSLDNDTWVDFPVETETPTILAGSRVYFRATPTTVSSDSGMGTFNIGGRCCLGGNIMSLMYGGDFEGQTYIGTTNMFRYLFRNQSSIEDASKLVLPAMYLASYCYYAMFYNCSGLISAPTTLPAPRLETYCYQYMFYGCTSLVNAPELKFKVTSSYSCSFMFQKCTSLVNAPELKTSDAYTRCYESMFSGCTSLVTAPELPATLLSSQCYTSMFEGCTSLVNAPALLARSTAEKCYQYMFRNCTSLVDAPEIGALYASNYCFSYMFYGCTSLVNAPELKIISASGSYIYDSMFEGCTSLVNAPEAIPFSGSGSNNCQYMFKNCTSLERAPELASTSLSSGCYQYMFWGCSHLKYIKALFTIAPSSTHLSNWVSGVPASGTFVKSPDATWENTFGVSAIPTGWTVEIAEAEA